MSIIGTLFALAMPLLPWLGLYLIIRHGPIRNFFWKGENPVGFAFFIGGVAFLAGFMGPILLSPGANQGPLLGIFLTGPLGLLLGGVWGTIRAWSRGRRESVGSSVA